MKFGDKLMKYRPMQTIIRVPKAQAAFVYFILESHEGLCFYSTLEGSIGTNYRDIEINYTIKLEKELSYVLGQLSKNIPIQFIKNSI